MKLSSVAVLLSASAAVLPGASAATLSLRGILPEVEELAAFANCDTKTNCGQYGSNSCDTIEKDCNGQCYWDNQKNKCSVGINRACKDYSNRSSCQNADCEWINNQCRTPQYTFRCSDYNNNRNQCQNEGCSWVSNRCVMICSDFDNKGRSTCEKTGLCTYNSGNCDIKQCSDLDGTSLNECERYTDFTCEWNQNNAQCNFSNNEEEEDFEEEEEVRAEEDVESEQ